MISYCFTLFFCFSYCRGIEKLFWIIFPTWMRLREISIKNVTTYWSYFELSLMSFEITIKNVNWTLTCWTRLNILSAFWQSITNWFSNWRFFSNHDNIGNLWHSFCFWSHSIIFLRNLVIPSFDCLIFIAMVNFILTSMSFDILLLNHL